MTQKTNVRIRPKETEHEIDDKGFLSVRKTTSLPPLEREKASCLLKPDVTV